MFKKRKNATKKSEKTSVDVAVEEETSQAEPESEEKESYIKENQTVFAAIAAGAALFTAAACVFCIWSKYTGKTKRSGNNLLDKFL